MNPNHEAMDDSSEWAVKHWEDVRCTADPCKCGQVACPLAGACQSTEDDDDQSDSADGEVLLMLIRWLMWGMAVGGAVWLLHELVSRL